MNDDRSYDPLLLTGAAKWCRRQIGENRVPLFSALLVGMMCYGYAFTNKLINHDDVQSMFNKGATVTSGRWGLGALDTIFPNYSMPWANGILTLIFIAIAACLIVRVLSIRSHTLQALLAGSVVAFPSLIGTFGYMFTSNSFGLSFLLASLAVWLLCRKGILFGILALGCMIFSLSIYQSYISLAAGLLVLVLLGQLLDGEDVLAVIRRGVGYVLFLILSLGLYYAATQIVLILKDEVLNSYASGNVSFQLSTIPASIALAYQNFFRFFTEGFHGLIPTKLSQLLHTLLVVGTLLLLVLRLTSAHLRSTGRIILAILLVGLIPLAVCCMYLFTAADSVHTLVLYGFVTVYALAILAMDRALDDIPMKCLSQIGTNLISLVLGLIIVSNVFLANEVWLNLQLRYENAFAFYTSVLSDLQALPEFTEEMPIAILGDHAEPEFYETEFSFCSTITGVKGFKPDSYSREKFFTYYLGVELPFLDPQACQALASEPDIAAMPSYPYYGSIQVVNGTIIVKLS